MLPTLGIDTLFRTALPPSDPNFLPSCTGRNDYLVQTGESAPDDDPSQPYQYFWSPAAAKLPPGVTLLTHIWNGSDLVMVSMTAGQLAKPNLPGFETFPFYQVPFTKSMWTQTPGFPANTFPSSWESKKADADALVAMFPGASLQTKEQCFPAAVFNLDPAFPDWDGWVMVMQNGVKTFAGGMLLEMYGPNSVNGGGRGNPGAWVANADGSSYAWVPKPHPSGQSVATLGTPCTAVPAGYDLQRVQNGITFIYALVPTGQDPNSITLVIPVAGTYTLTRVG